MQTDIVLTHISKKYHDTPVFSDLTLTLHPGRIYCLTAPSGAGKTTLLGILMGLILPDSGSISGLRQQRISAVFQTDRLLEQYNALQNIRFVTGKRISDAAITERLTALLPGDCLMQPVSEFSGGMKRRLSILRALFVPFDLLCMDEPFAGLDPANRLAAIELIKKQAAHKTVIIATHEPQDAALFQAESIALPPTERFHKIP